MTRVDIHDPFCSSQDLLTWTDPRIAATEAHVATLREHVATLARVKTPQAKYARDQYKAEIERCEALLAAVPSLGVERAALERVFADVRTHAAAALPDNVDAELLRLATRNVLDRAHAKARNAFVAAALASQLPNVPSWGRARAKASEETRDLARHAPKLTDFEQGYANLAFDVASLQGGSAEPEVALHYAEAESDHAGDESFEILCALRWFRFARRHALEHEDYSAILERIEQEQARTEPARERARRERAYYSQV